MTRKKNTVFGVTPLQEKGLILWVKTLCVDEDLPYGYGEYLNGYSHREFHYKTSTFLYIYICSVSLFIFKKTKEGFILESNIVKKIGYTRTSL